MLKQRIVTALLLFLLLLAALFWLPPIAWSGVVVLLIMQGAAEWAHLSRFSPNTGKLFWGTTLALMLLILWSDTVVSGQRLIFQHLAVYGVSAIFWLFVVPTALMIGWRVKNPILMALTGWAVLIPTGLAMIDLRAAQPSPWILLAVMALVWIADTGAYFAGKRFGKHKLAPSISPGKTWEGVAGAMLGVTIYAILIWKLTPSIPPGVLPGLMLAAWWWVGLSVMGDLFESAVKRHAGVKDSGALLPGHGGLLDRIDALTSTLPLAAMALLFQHLG